MRILKLADFSLNTQWQKSSLSFSERYIYGLPENNVLKDQSTGTYYWHLPERTLRMTCLKLTVQLPGKLFQKTLSECQTALKTTEVSILRHQWTLLCRNLLLFLRMPFALAALELTAIYALFRPQDGRKLFTSVERLFFSTLSLSSVFHPQISASIPKKIALLSLKSLFVYRMQIGLFHTFIFIHELGHWIAIKALFTDVNPYIVMDGLYSYCAGGGPAMERSWLGQWVTLTTCRGISAMGGPLLEIISDIGARAVFSRSSDFLVELGAASWIALTAVHLAVSPSTDSVFGDFAQMSACFGIRQKHLVVGCVAYALSSLPLFYKNYRKENISSVPQISTVL